MFVLKNAWAALGRVKWRTALTALLALLVSFSAAVDLAVLRADDKANNETYQSQKASAVIRPSAKVTAKRDGADSNYTANYMTWDMYTKYAEAVQKNNLTFEYTLATSVPVRASKSLQAIAAKSDTSEDNTGGNLTLQAFYTNDAAKINDYGYYKVVKGKHLSYKTQSDGVLISQALADKNNLKVGDKVKGRVVVMADYGAFVEIAPGVEGLIHVSEMSWSQHLRSAQEFMKVGDEVEAVILTLDREERKMSLGIKQLTPDPWENIEVKYPVGTKTTAKVRNFTNFGVFVEIEEGIDGLIHISDLSWTKKVKHPGEFTSVGADIEVVVLEIDKENRRLSLGHKQLEENPWNEFENQYSVDSIHEGTITEMTDKGAVVALGENIEGFCPARQLVKEDGTTPKTGDKLNFKILEFSKATKRITLSHLRTYEEAKRAEIAAEKAEKRAAADATKSTVKKINASVEKTTLGDIAGLAALKSAMEAAEAKSAKKAAAKKEDEE